MSRLSLAAVKQKGDEHTWDIFRDLHFGRIFPSEYHNTGVRSWKTGLNQGQDWRDAMLESLQPQEDAAAPLQANLTEEQRQKLQDIADTKRSLFLLLRDMIEAEKGLQTFQSAEVNDAELWQRHMGTLDRVDEVSRLLDTYDSLTGFEQMGDPAMQAIHGYVRGLNRVKNRLDLEADRLNLADQTAEYRRFLEQYNLYKEDPDEIRRINDWAGDCKIRLDPETLGNDLNQAEKAIDHTKKLVRHCNGLAKEYEKKAEAARSLELKIGSGWYYTCRLGAPMSRIADSQDKFLSELRRISEERGKLLKEAEAPADLQLKQTKLDEEEQRIRKAQEELETAAGEEIKEIREKYHAERQKYLEQHHEPYDPEKVDRELKRVEANVERLRRDGYTAEKFTEKFHTEMQRYRKAKNFDPAKYDYKDAPDAANAPEYIRWYRAGKAARDLAKTVWNTRLVLLRDYQKDLGDAVTAVDQFNRRHDHEANRAFIQENINRPVPNNPTLDERVQKLQDSFTRLCVSAENSGWGGSKTLGDSKEFTRMKNALQTLTQPNQMTSEHVREAREAARSYLNAKAGGIHWTNSTIRQFRLNLARNIRQLSDSASGAFEMIGDETKLIKNFKVLARSLDQYEAKPLSITQPEGVDGYDRMKDIMSDDNVLIQDARKELQACVKDAEQAAQQSGEPKKEKAAGKQPDQPAPPKAASPKEQNPMLPH